MSEDNGNLLDWGAVVETEPWHEAGLEADAAWEQFQRASNPIEFAIAVDRMNNAMANLITWLPGYSYDTGRVENYDG